MIQNAKYFLGFDFGASSGRAILGALGINEKGLKALELNEIHRFPNEAVRVNGSLKWEIERLFNEVKIAIGKAAKLGVHLEAIGIDTWGVDFGIVSDEGKLVFAPTAYRDERTEGMIDEAAKILPKKEIFEETGLAFLNFNTLYQLLAMKKNPETAKLLKKGNKVLFMPDLFAWYLTGKMGTEYTIASTGQLINPKTRDWSERIFEKFGFSHDWFAPLQQPGTVRGMLKKEICPEIDYEVPVIAVASHDTASAVAAVPAKKNENFAYLSSGTWSILGVETVTPVCEESVMNANFSNEGGLNGTTRLLKNIMGLWIIQECRKQFNAERKEKGLNELSFNDIVDEVFALPKPEWDVINVDDSAFFLPDNMADRVSDYVEKHGGKINSETRVGQIADIVYKGLALKYRWGVEKLAEITGEGVDTLYIVGGGGKNELLNRYTASCLGKAVKIGASESTVIGNILVQAMGTGDVKDLWELRQIVSNSFENKTYEPETAQKAEWEEAYQAFKRILEA